MVRRILLQLAFAVLALVSASFAQTVHTFSFAPYSPYDPTVPFSLIDGNPPDQSIGYAGLIQIRYNENPWWGMEAPEGPYNCAGEPVCGWGFPNNGYLENNTVYPTAGEGQLVWDNPGCGPKIVGCTAHTDTTIQLTGYGQGVTYTVHDTFIVNKHPCNTRYCRPFYLSTDENGGSGTAVYIPQ